MKFLFFLIAGCFLLITACQKSSDVIENDTDTDTENDTTLRAGDMVMYEVLTSDTGGWYGVWNDSTGQLSGSTLDNGDHGNAINLQSGWTYTFTCPDKPLQAFISVNTHNYKDDITVNLYKNGHLIKTSTNNPGISFAKLIATAQTSNLIGTTADPVVTYEVLVTDPDTSKFQSDSWTGTWIEADGFNSLVLTDADGNITGYTLGYFGIPSNWRRSFKPLHLPFTMYMTALPFSEKSGKVIVNFYVNGQLVKTGSTTDGFFNTEYIVQ